MLVNSLYLLRGVKGTKLQSKFERRLIEIRRGYSSPDHGPFYRFRAFSVICYIQLMEFYLCFSSYLRTQSSKVWWVFNYYLRMDFFLYLLLLAIWFCRTDSWCISSSNCCWETKNRIFSPFVGIFIRTSNSFLLIYKMAQLYYVQSRTRVLNCCKLFYLGYGIIC